jgi:hypothetical protein
MTKVDDPALFDEILRGYFSGKRDALRACRLLPVSVSGRHGMFQAMAVDISSSGTLIRVMDPDFAAEQEVGHLMPYTARVWYHFEGGMRIRFLDTDVEVAGDVVRVTGYCGRGSSLILIGCRFSRLLDDAECDALGVERAEDRPPKK